MRLFLLISVVITFVSCSGKLEKDIKVQDTFKINRDLEVELIDFDSITSSSDGFFRFLNDEFYYFDIRFSSVQIYSKDGKFKRSALGKGDGPNEINSFKYHIFKQDGSSLFLATNYQLSQYSPVFSKEKAANQIDFNREKEEYKRAEYLEIGTYAYDFYNFRNSSNLLFLNDDYIYFPLYISPNINKELNGYNGNFDYYEKSLLIGKADINSGKVIKVFGERSQSALAKGFVESLDFVTIAFRDDNILVGHALDNDIQVYDQLDNYLETLTVDYDVLDENYIQIKSYEESEKSWQKVYRDQTFYYHLYVSDELIFRSYNKKSGEDGLIILKGNTIIADVSVPKRFSMIGEDDEFFYADGLIDEENEKYGVYKFKKGIE